MILLATVYGFKIYFTCIKFKTNGRKFIEIISKKETFGQNKQTHQRQLTITNIKPTSLNAISGTINESYSFQNQNHNPKPKQRVSDYKVIKVKRIVQEQKTKIQNLRKEQGVGLEREIQTAVLDVGCKGQRYNQTKRKEEGGEKLESKGLHRVDYAICKNR